MQELEREIKNVDGKIHHTESTLKDLRKLQDQIATKSGERSTLLLEQQKRYRDLAEENEGLSNGVSHVVEINISFLLATLSFMVFVIALSVQVGAMST